MTALMPVVKLEALDLGSSLGKGAIGTVSRLRQPPAGFTGELAFKRYLPAARARVDDAALRRFIEFPTTLSSADATRMRERLAWPLAAVYESPGVVSGFLMSEIPSHYTLEVAGRRAPAGMEFLLNGAEFERRLGIVMGREARLRLLLDLCRLIAFLHEVGIVVGDLSPKNVLFSLADAPRCFLIDCDSMSVDRLHLLPPLQTPGWEVPRGEDPQTRASDAYKFALLAIRLFAGDQATRNPQALSEASSGLGRLALATTTALPAARPRISEWLAPLQAAIEAPGRATAVEATRPRPSEATEPPPPQFRSVRSARPSKPSKWSSLKQEPRLRLLFLAALVIVTLALLPLSQSR